MNNTTTPHPALPTELLDLGFKVFPIARNSKQPPLIKDWEDYAACISPEGLRAMAQQNPDCNWAVATGASNLTVIDVDTKQGKVGRETLKALEAKYGQLPETLTVETPSGGLHLYYAGLSDTSTAKLGKDIDTRSRGGYVVAPGSKIDGNYYRIIKNLPVAVLPDWVLRKLRERKERLVLNDGEKIPEGIRHKTLVSWAGTVRTTGAGKEEILAFLQAASENRTEGPPMPDSEIERIATDVAKYTPRNAAAILDFERVSNVFLKSAGDFDENDIPRRDWIIPDLYLGSFITVIVAPGGTGKSTLMMLDAISIVTGRPLSTSKRIKKGAVWLYNTEDPQEELKRKVIAIRKQHNISAEELKELYITSGRDMQLLLAKTGREGLVVNTSQINNIIETIKSHKIVLFIIDPFVRCHEVSENDNTQIDKVMNELSRIAHETGCAIAIVHHTSKAAMNPKADTGDVNASRGASAITSAARIAFNIRNMSEKEAKDYGIEEEKHSYYMKREMTKGNVSPPSSEIEWFEKKSTTLNNGDSVGVAQMIALANKKDERLQVRVYETCQEVLKWLKNAIKAGESISLKDASERLLRAKIGFLEYFENYRTIEGKLKDWLTAKDNQLPGFELEHKEGRKTKYYIKRVA